MRLTCSFRHQPPCRLLRLEPNKRDNRTRQRSFSPGCLRSKKERRIADGNSPSGPPSSSLSKRRRGKRSVGGEMGWGALHSQRPTCENGRAGTHLPSQAEETVGQRSQSMGSARDSVESCSVEAVGNEKVSCCSSLMVWPGGTLTFQPVLAVVKNGCLLSIAS